MIPRLHSRDNKEITPDEKVVLASMIKMSKILNTERGHNHQYLPQRLVLRNYNIGWWYNTSAPNTKLRFTIQAPIKFVNLLHPTRTMCMVEHSDLNDENVNQSGGYGPPFSYNITLPDIPSTRDWVDSYTNVGTLSTYKGDIVNPVINQAQPSSIVWTGLSVKTDASFYAYPMYNVPVNTNIVGFPITDIQYLNNNYINIVVEATDMVHFTQNLPTSPGGYLYYTFDLALVFYQYTGELYEKI